MTWTSAFVLSMISFATAFAALRPLVAALQRHKILDRPNPRSNHKTPTPRGGGLAIVATLLPVWGGVALLGAPDNEGGLYALAPLLAGALFLAFLSWADDRRGLGPWVRLCAHFLAAGAGIFSLSVFSPVGHESLVFQGLLPFWADRLAALFLLVWFINLFNFMDGIDGLAGSEAAFLGAGIALVIGAGVSFAPPTPTIAIYALTLGAASLAFLCWNWDPAKVFMGDVGSVPLGFLLGWLLLMLAAMGHFAAAMILPLYYLADSGWTLLVRLVQGEKVWHAHTQHFYQCAVRQGLSHAHVVKKIMLANAGLFGLAVGAEVVPAPAAVPLAIAGGMILVAALLRHLARGA